MQETTHGKIFVTTLFILKLCKFYCAITILNNIYTVEMGTGRAGLGRAGRGLNLQARGRNGPKNFSFAIHHCVRDCMQVNVPSNCTCVISLFLTDRKGARNI